MAGPTRQAVLAEFVGTFLLVLIGCGTILSSGNIEKLDPNAVGGHQSALLCAVFAFSVSILFLVTTLRDVSGCHINPAVSFAMLLKRNMDWQSFLWYLAAQFAGATGASLVHWALIPYSESFALGATRLGYHTSPWQGMFIEMFATFILLLVIIGNSHKENNFTVAFTVAPVIAGDILFCGPLTGASMNPARSFGPGLVSSTWRDQWIYYVGPFLGAALAVVMAPLFDFNSKAKRAAVQHAPHHAHHKTDSLDSNAAADGPLNYAQLEAPLL